MGSIIIDIKNSILRKFSKGSKYNIKSDQIAIRMVNEVIADMRMSNDENIQKIANNMSYFETMNINICYKSNNTSLQENYFCPNAKYGMSILNLNINDSKNVVAHELGHLIQDLVDNTLPEDYERIQEISISNLTNKVEFYKEVLNKCIKCYKDISEKVYNKLEEYKKNNPELIKKMVDELYNDERKRNDFIQKRASVFPDLLSYTPEKIYSFIKNNILMDQYDEEMAKARMNDDTLSQITTALDILKSLNNGQNYFFENEDEYVLYLNDVYNHQDDYYERQTGINFSEQFANYMVLKVYPEKYSFAISILRNTIGDEWFNMMDEKYKSIANKMSFEEKNKTR